MQLPDLVYLVIGAAALLAGLLPRLLAGRPLSLPIVFLGVGALFYLLVPSMPDPDPLAHPALAEHLTEIGVLVALMGAGLRLDRPIGWRAWGTTWRLLIVAMPLSIGVGALLGWWWLGLVPASAVLLGSALAPTDPVLASDVQVGEPGGHAHSEDEVRFSLTSEAGLNDALAFPFVYAAIAMASVGAQPSAWIGDWLLQDVLIKLAIGTIGGVVVGRLLGRLFFRSRSSALHLASQAEGFIALAATLLAYGVTEVAGGYGFLAVFLCARSIRATERDSGYHEVLHNFVEQIERLLIVLLLVLLGGAVVRGLLEPLTWPAVAVAVTVVFVVRPLVARLALSGTRIGPGDRTAISVFGIRGIGSLFYLAYATVQARFVDSALLWAVTGLVVVLSVVVHGITATPIMNWLDRRRDEDGTSGTGGHEPSVAA